MHGRDVTNVNVAGGADGGGDGSKGAGVETPDWL